MIVYTKAGLRIGELYFDDTSDTGGVDIARYRARPARIDGADVAVNHTILIDLAQAPDQLLAGMNKTTRNLIRRGEGDPTAIEFLAQPSPELVARFAAEFDRFARSKGLPVCNRERLDGLRSAGALAISIARLGEESIVWHAYILSGTAARLLFSAIPSRSGFSGEAMQLVSRANRRQHYLDMLHLKELGYLTYDFGGWYSGLSDVEQLKVNQFKEAFGGQIATVYDADRSLTTKGYVALKLRRWKDRARSGMRGAA